MTTGSSMQAMTLTVPPQVRLIAMSRSPKAPTFGEDPLQALRPGHGCPVFGRRAVLRLIRCFGLVVLPVCYV